MNMLLTPISRNGATYIFVVFAITACVGPQLYHRQLSVLDKGLSPSQAIGRLNLSPRSEKSVTVGNRPFDFHMYRLSSGVQSDIYFLAYERQRLVYWGYISEFRRQPDQELNVALNKVLNELSREQQQSEK